MRVRALAVVGVVALAVGGGLTAGVAVAAPAEPAERLYETITCNSLEVDGSTVFGQTCDSEQWGPLEDFTLAGRGGRVFQCQSGWAEGSLWVRGEDCRRVQ